MTKVFDDVNGFDDIYTHGECWNCGFPIYDDMNICSHCGERCEPEEGIIETTCPECSGTGLVDQEIKESFASQRISPRYKKVICGKCKSKEI
jgi:predicted amidophosphoribosyltransferase